MKIVLNILFYIFGIGLPVFIILFAVLKNRKKAKNIINKILIAVIIFLIFYMVKVGGVNLMDKVRDNKEIKTTIITNKTTISSEVTSTTTTTKTLQENNNTKDLKIIDGILIVNKTYSLPKNYVPTNTYKDATGLNYCTTCLDKVTYEKYKEMKADATAMGLNIWIQSGYRSYNLQESLYSKYVNRDGKEAADTYSARPGHSEHQTGLAFDLNSITDDFQYTNEGIWINNNCYKYGFILRYPKGKEHITGYKYESWHLRYVGVELATKLYNNGDWITLEEHFNLTSTYDN